MASSHTASTPVPFPQPEDIRNPSAPTDSPTNAQRNRTSTDASTTSNRIRTASIKLMEATPPAGMWAATGATVSKAPSLKDIRRGSFGAEGWNHETQRKRAGSRTSNEDRARNASAAVPPKEGTEPFPAVTEEDTRERRSSDSTRRTPSYSGKNRNVDGAVELRETATGEDKTDHNASRQPLTSSGEVRAYRTLCTTRRLHTNVHCSMPTATYRLRSCRGHAPSPSA
jgi:hypothetical protein